jgi:hypothetical protein
MVLVFVLATSSMATWTVTASKVSDAGHYYKWKLVCTSDGSAYSATDILTSSVMSNRVLREIQGETLMLMKVSPGTSGVIPDNTINIILSDDEQDALYTKTGISKDAISWHSINDDIGIYIPIMGKLYLTFNDIGSSGDQVTLYFITWKEDD